MYDNQEVFDINTESLYENKSFVEQANVIIHWKNNHLKPKTLFCLSDNANEREIKKRYKKLCLHFHSDKNPGHEAIASQAIVILTEAKDYLLYELQAVHSYEEKQQIVSNIFYDLSYSKYPVNMTSSKTNFKFNPTFFTGLDKGVSVISICSYSANNRFRPISLCRNLLSASCCYNSKLNYCYDYFNNNTASLFPMIPEQIKADILSNRALLTENLLGPEEATTFNILHLTATSENAELFVWLLNQGADLSITALGEWSVSVFWSKK